MNRDVMHRNTAFHNAFFLAAFLHVAGLAVFSLPKWDTPPPPEVSTLRIKLQPQASRVLPEPQPLSALEPASGSTGSNNTSPPAKEKPTAPAPGTSLTSAPKKEEIKKQPKPIPVKPVALFKPQMKPTAIPGNSTEKDAETVQRYEQMLGLWFEQHHYYPMAARQKELQGDAVMRVTLDRSGNILHAELEKKTGDELLDEAAMVMVKKANPAPKFPSDYPAGERFEYLIPISFRME